MLNLAFLEGLAKNNGQVDTTVIGIFMQLFLDFFMAFHILAVQLKYRKYIAMRKHKLEWAMRKMPISLSPGPIMGQGS